MSSRRRNIAIGGVVLAGLSYLAGILTAPKSGRETRKGLSRAAHKAMTEAERRLKTAHSELNILTQQLEQRAEQGKSTVNKELKEALDKAGKVKLKTRELLSAIHEGEAADKDLNEAIKEVKASIKHLKSFVTKANK